MSLYHLFDRRDRRADQGPLTFARLLGLGVNTAAGVPMSEDQAETLSALWRAATVISSVSAATPIVAYKSGTHEAASPYPRILTKPHPYLVPYQLWRLVYWHLFFSGIAIHRKVTNRAGQLVQLDPIAPRRAEVFYDRRTGDRALVLDGDRDRPLISTEFALYMANSEDGISGRSLITVARESLGIAKAAETVAAKQFGNGSMVSGILTTDEELEEDEIEAAKARWRAKFTGIDNAHDVVVTHSGLHWQQVGMSNSDAQFLQSRHFAIEEVARWTGVPLFLLSESEKSTSWGTGLSEQATGFVKFDLAPNWLTPMEQQITQDILLNPQVEAHYDVSGLLRGDSKALVEFLTAMWGLAALSPNEVRDAIGKPPSDEPGMDMHFIRVPGSKSASPLAEAIKPAALPAAPTDTPADSEDTTEEDDAA